MSYYSNTNDANLNTLIIAIAAVSGVTILVTFIGLCVDSCHRPLFEKSLTEDCCLKSCGCCDGNNEFRIRKIAIFLWGFSTIIFLTTWAVFYAALAYPLCLTIFILSAIIYSKFIRKRSHELVKSARTYRIVLVLFGLFLFVNCGVAAYQATVWLANAFDSRICSDGYCQKQYLVMAGIGYVSCFFQVLTACLSIALGEHFYRFLELSAPDGLEAARTGDTGGTCCGDCETSMSFQLKGHCIAIFLLTLFIFGTCWMIYWSAAAYLFGLVILVLSVPIYLDIKWESSNLVQNRKLFKNVLIVNGVLMFICGVVGGIQAVMAAIALSNPMVAPYMSVFLGQVVMAFLSFLSEIVVGCLAISMGKKVERAEFAREKVKGEIRARTSVSSLPSRYSSRPLPPPPPVEEDDLEMGRKSTDDDIL